MKLTDVQVLHPETALQVGPLVLEPTAVQHVSPDLTQLRLQEKKKNKKDLCLLFDRVHQGKKLPSIPTEGLQRKPPV